MKQIATLILTILSISLLTICCKEEEPITSEKCVAEKTVEEKAPEKQKDSGSKLQEDKSEIKRKMTAEERAYYDKFVALYSKNMESDDWLKTDDLEKVEIPGGGFFMFPVIGPMSHTISENGKYVAVIGGTDVVGFIAIFDLDSQEKLLNESYGGGSGWEGDSLSFDSVQFKGSGYTLSQKTVFKNGEIEKGKEFLGRYHVLFYPSPFSSYFDLKDKQLLELMELTRMAADMADRMSKGKFNHQEIINKASIYKDKDISSEEVLELMILSKERYLKLDPEDIEQKEALFQFFDIVYPIIHKSAEEGLINQKERIEFIDNFFEYINFDKTLVPWLFE